MNYPLLQIKNLQINFLQQQKLITAVQQMDLTLHHGETLAIVGESGSGKSVTALSVLQLLSAKTVRYPSGEILFSPNGGVPVNLLTAPNKILQTIRGKQIGMIFQEPMSSLNPVYTCGNQVMETIMNHKQEGYRAAYEQTLALFARVKLPDPKNIFKRYPHELSGGQKQRVMIAIAMCCTPKILICDEPTTALDVTVQKTILELITQLQQETGMGVIFITHDLGIVKDIAHHVLVMFKGKIVESGSTLQLFEKPAHPYTKALLACRPGLHEPGVLLPVVSDFMEITADGNIQEKEFLQVSEVATSHPSVKPANCLLEVKALNVWFTGKKQFLGKAPVPVKAVQNVSFSLTEGETLGLVGESGCGKSTLGRALMHLVPVTSGEILYNGHPLQQPTREELTALRLKVQLIFQDPYGSLNPRMRIGDAIAEPLLVHKLEKNTGRRKQKVIEMLEKVGLSATHYSRYPHEFSGGQRQRIVIARALILNPSLIICDESVSALDVSVQAQVLNLLNSLKKELGFTAIFISHDLSVVRYISNRILVMNKGSVEEIGTAEEVYSNPKTEYTRKLLNAIPGKKPIGQG